MMQEEMMQDESPLLPCGAFKGPNPALEGSHDHDWQPLGFVLVHGGRGLAPADGCRCGAKRYAESSGHFGEPFGDG